MVGVGRTVRGDTLVEFELVVIREQGNQLAYEAHPDALEHLRKVAERICDDPAVTALAAVHRTGDLKIGDAAVIVAVAAAHRDVAFAACRRAIDDLKAEVPIWKHQHFTDGASEWVGAH